ncbi:MAG TPA: histidine kinase dimerization/phospho-acceptor domain-containing protein, partial [Chthoniobacterales bacterium]|nr:histidine kinase dimerization/phospho-acceptor domain-containing protein [Chthoniobacterales bacterium]
MSIPTVCILYTQDADLVRRVKAFLRVIAQVRHVAEPDRLDAVLQQASPALLLMDLRAKDSRDLLDQVQKEWPEVLITALGTPRSEPLREAEQAGVYAAEDLQLDRRRFQGLVARGFDHLRLMLENRELREQSALVPVAAEPPRRLDNWPERSVSTSMPLLRFPRVFRRFDNVEALLASVVEGVADAAGVTRVGIFSRIRQSDRYRLRAGLRCLPETYEVEYGERDPLVRWFELHAHLICRSNLAHAADHAQRALMRRALDTFGAEVIVPLHARGRIIGWLFFGHRVTGQRFEYSDLENLMILAEHVSTVLENALLYEEIALQKTLAETLLKSIPLGIVATDEEAVVRWFNPTAGQILGLESQEVINRAVESVGNRLASSIRETLELKTNLPPQQWIDANTRRSLSVETRRLVDQRTPLGAVAVIHDLTNEESLRQKQDLLDRAAFWTDLAASMSHEIRNPLVAIKTFAQLLPERFEDADFRKDFNQIVVQEIDRLDKIISQINNFAHPPELVMKPIDLRHPVKKALEVAREKFNTNGTPVEINLPNDLPKVLGDETALTEAFAHLVANAAEATAGQPTPRITL